MTRAPAFRGRLFYFSALTRGGSWAPDISLRIGGGKALRARCRTGDRGGSARPAGGARALSPPPANGQISGPSADHLAPAASPTAAKSCPPGAGWGIASKRAPPFFFGHQKPYVGGAHSCGARTQVFRATKPGPDPAGGAKKIFFCRPKTTIPGLAGGPFGLEVVQARPSPPAGQLGRKARLKVSIVRWCLPTVFCFFLLGGLRGLPLASFRGGGGPLSRGI